MPSTTEGVVVDAERLQRLKDAAYRIRTNALVQAEVQGQGYIGQALDIADVLAVLYADQLSLRPEDPEWEDRDRCLLSIGHYAIALYAALAEARFFPLEELQTYATDDSRLPMSAMASYTPGVEISGGSLGHGLTIANGVALGLKRKGNPAFVYNILSDGELNEGSTWEAAAVAAHHRLDNLIAIVDFNDDLNLPPVSDDPEAGSGYARFSVKARQGVPLNTIITNEAMLAFDYGQPFQSNTTQTKVQIYNPNDPLLNHGLPMGARPNPAVYYLKADWNFQADAPGRLTLTDMAGVLWVDLPVELIQHDAQFDVTQIPEGAYVLFVDAGSRHFVRTVFVAHTVADRRN